MIRAALGVALAIGMAGPAAAQTLTIMKGIDAPHYDAQRTSWGPTCDIVNMFQDTLVALDWDGRTPIPYLAKSWTISEDGRSFEGRWAPDPGHANDPGMVAYEFAKVRFLYEAKLGIGDRCELEWFVGPHTIHGVGTYKFLHRHLNWPEP